jgi:hypothetical protein
VPGTGHVPSRTALSHGLGAAGDTLSRSRDGAWHRPRRQRPRRQRARRSRPRPRLGFDEECELVALLLRAARHLGARRRIAHRDQQERPLVRGRSTISRRKPIGEGAVTVPRPAVSMRWSRSARSHANTPRSRAPRSAAALPARPPRESAPPSRRRRTATAAGSRPARSSHRLTFVDPGGTTLML